MKKSYAGVLTAYFLILTVLGYFVIKNPINGSYFNNPLTLSGTYPLESINAGISPAFPNPANTSQEISAKATVSELFTQKNLTEEEESSLQTWNRSKHLPTNASALPNDGISPAPPSPANISQEISTEAAVSKLFTQTNLTKEEESSLQTWNRFKHLATNASTLPNAVEAIKEAAIAWENLMTSVEEERVKHNRSLPKRETEKQCPRFLSKVNVSVLDSNKGFMLPVPCGLSRGSSITFIGIPGGNFRVDLIGEKLPEELYPPIILDYNVQIIPGNITEDPVIVQNAWTVGHAWGTEEVRCPSRGTEKNKKVGELEQCNEFVGKETNGKPRKYFPFKQNELFVATIGVGSEGIHMTVDGKHITSFVFRETLEPFYVSKVRISGHVNLTSVVATGLPKSGDLDHIDLEALKAVPLPNREKLNLFIGVLSAANNYQRRMAVRRSWMQYPQIRLGPVAVRFFVGLHKNQTVNEELWKEARTYGDIQLMPFVDYYSIITWKTIAICIFGTEVVSAKFIMKTDDDAFVRVDEILNSLKRTNVTHGLLYGLINSDSGPQRGLDSKWYISPEEWADDIYPPFAPGPGYVVSSDIARMVSKKHRKGRLKMFKLEDVAMGIWIADMKKKKKGLQVRYEKDERIINLGCHNGYVVAHYQGPREIRCLWKKIQQQKAANCCGY